MQIRAERSANNIPYLHMCDFGFDALKRVTVALKNLEQQPLTINLSALSYVADDNNRIP